MTFEPANASTTLGPQVRRLREAAGLSQAELARRLQVRQPRISQIENDRDPGPLRPRMLRDLADALGVDLPTLVGTDPRYALLDLGDIAPLAPPARLDSSAVPLVGRAGDLAAVTAAFQDGVRLLTLLGPGGVGKTQLALHAASVLAPLFPDGLALAPLETCRDATAVLAAIARGLGVRERDERPLRQRLRGALGHGRRLLLLDNAEQAAAVVAALAAELLASCPSLAVLVTSRAPLNIRPERTYEVRPLAVPDPADEGALVATASPAVALFVERARAVAPGFALTAANAADVAAICRCVDGLPLAIELAASRLRVFSTSQVLRQMERPLAALASGMRGLPERQRSMRANIAWSVDLLSPAEHLLFRRLAVFSGSFTLDAAFDVAGHAPAPGAAPIGQPDVASGVGALLEQHLLTRSEQDGAPRFAMLETIHDYAREQLASAGETAALEGRRLTWCLALAEAAVPRMFTAAEPEWLSRLQAEDANLHAALDWALGPGRGTALEAGLRLAGALSDYWSASGQLSRGRACLGRAIDLSPAVVSLGRARSLAGACMIEQIQAAADPAERHAREALALATSLADHPTIGRALLFLGNLAMMRDELAEARALHERALAEFRGLGDQAWTALALVNLGIDFYREGDLAPAAAYAEECLAIAREIGNRWDALVALRLLGEVARVRGELDRATALFAETLILSWRLGSDRESADSLSGLGAVAAAAHDFERAARLLGAAEALYRRQEIAVPPPLRLDWQETVDAVRRGLDVARFSAAWQSTPPERAVLEYVPAHHAGR
jgi:non-specific serine/threonine protein kinase